MNISLWDDSIWWTKDCGGRTDRIVIFFKCGESLSVDYTKPFPEEYIKAKESRKEIQAIAIHLKRFNAWACIWQGEKNRTSVSGFKTPEDAFESIKLSIKRRKKG